MRVAFNLGGVLPRQPPTRSRFSSVDSSRAANSVGSWSSVKDRPSRSTSGSGQAGPPEASGKPGLTVGKNDRLALSNPAGASGKSEVLARGKRVHPSSSSSSSSACPAGSIGVVRGRTAACAAAAGSAGAGGCSDPPIWPSDPASTSQTARSVTGAPPGRGEIDCIAAAALVTRSCAATPADCGRSGPASRRRARDAGGGPSRRSRAARRGREGATPRARDWT